MGSPDHALIDNRCKLLSYLDGQRQGMLYDITLDPGGRCNLRYNLVEKLPETAKAMRAELAAWDASCARSNAGADYAR